MPHDSKSTENMIKEQSITGRLFILLKDSVVYGILLAVSKFAILLILPITTRYLSIGDYGALDTIMLTGTLFTIIMIVGQDEALGRFYYDNKDETYRKSFLTTVFVIIIPGSAIGTIAIYNSAHSIVILLFGNAEYIREFQLMLIYAPVTMLITFFRSIMRWTFNKKAFFILSAGPTVLILVLTFIFIIIFNWGVAGAIYAQILSNVFFIAVAAFLSRNCFICKVNQEILIPLLKYGSPVMLMVACASLIPVIDKGMYSYFFGSDTLGLYSLASRYSMFMAIPLTAFITAWGPVLFTTYKEDNANQTIQNVLLSYTALFSAAFYIQMMFAEPIITLIASDKYIASIYYVAPISMSLILEYFSSVTAAGTDISKKTYLHAISILSGIILMLAVVYPLVKLFGSIGIAYCVLAGRLFSHLLRTAASYYTHPFRYKLARSYIAFCLTFALSLFCQNIPIQNPTSAILFRLALFLLLLCYIWAILLSQEIKKIIFEKSKQYFSL